LTHLFRLHHFARLLPLLVRYLLSRLLFTMLDATRDGVTLELKGQPPVFEEERDGWKGYIEWEAYAQKKAKAKEILAQYNFEKVSRQGVPVQTSHDG
jgi:hypothetical protein